MSFKPEQIGRDRRWVNLNGRWIKKITHRFWRRQGKQLLDDAPKRAYYKQWAG